VAAITRREFVGRTAKLAGGAVLAAQLEWLAACGGSGRKGPSDADWERLARRLRGGRLVRPGDAPYASLRLPFNLRYAYIRPAGIAVCTRAEDIRQAILWARDHDVSIAARAGGHSYAGYSTTPGLLVDLSRMTAVAVRSDPATVDVRPGARNTGIYAALQPHGVAISAGRCPTVAVSGLALGGGFGFSSRHLGLTSDALLETDVVTADGRILTCNERQNADLFWACRGGGGGNFGINTRFVFRTAPVSDVTLYDLTWKWRDARKALAALQDVIGEMPDEWSCRIGFGSSGNGGRTTQKVRALGQFFGPKRDLLSILDPLLSAARPTEQLIARRTFWQAKNYFFDTTPIGRFAVKSNYVSRPFSSEGIDTIVSAVERWPGSSNEDGGGVALFAWGAAINRVAPDATAFVHRDALFLMAYDTAWGPHDPRRVVDANVHWLARLEADIAPHVSGFSYQNFIDRSLEDWKHAYYGANLERLVRVKRKYDPDHFFHFEQGIPT
jgi:FAD binding domain/Berberine and berberine like